MKREVFLAIAIGFALGLVITFGIWTANKSLKGLPSANATPTPLTVSATPTTTSSDTNPALSLALTAPADESLVSTNKVTVSGKTAAGATIVVLTENGQQIVSADASGNFSLAVDLVAGYNLIRIASYDQQGNMAQEALTVTYTTAKV